MKLKFDKKRGYSILEAVESITDHDAQVLQAGLIKFFKASKDPLILCLSAAQLDAGALRVAADFQLVAFEANALLIVVSAIKGLGQFATLREATQLLISGASLIDLKLRVLTALHDRITCQNQELVLRIKVLNDHYVVEKDLPAANARLEQQLTKMLTHAVEFLKRIDAREERTRLKSLSAYENQILLVTSEKPYLVAPYLSSAKKDELLEEFKF